jgi:hypothetical protein
MAGWIVMTHFGLAGNSTPSADQQYAVFVAVANEMPQYAKCFRLVGHQYDSHTATYIFACQSVDPGKAEWLVFVPSELANNVNVVCALFNQATVDHDSWKEELVNESSDQ